MKMDFITTVVSFLYVILHISHNIVVFAFPPAANRTDNDSCLRENIDCSRIFGQYCCREGRFIRCCTTSEIQPTYKNPSGDAHWFHRFSMWNMWYLWFMVVLIMATCFTGCNYWRRQRRPQNFRLFQRQYTTIGGNGVRNNERNSQRVVFPITMYEIPPDAILRVMRENTLAGAGGSGDHGRRRACRYHTDQHNQDSNLGPPSYCEVTSEPNKYPPKVVDADLPSYEAVSQSLKQEGVARQEGPPADSSSSV